MWKNDRKKTIIFNILIFIILVGAVAALGHFYRQVKTQIDAEDRELSAANSSQRQQLNENRQENLEAIQLAYEADLQAVEKYLPGIVCWGDSLTTGTSGNVSYPYTLQKYLNAYISDIYDFRSSVENAADYPKLKWSDYKVSIPVVNMGGGQDNSATVLGRAGVSPYITKKEFTIPAKPEGVAIEFTAGDGKQQVAPLSAGSVGINPVTIAGVKGTLSMVANGDNVWNDYSYQFTRLEAGKEVTVEKGTEIISAATNDYTDYIHIVWLGTYDIYRSAELLVKDVQQLLSRQTENTDRYLVIGPCTYGSAWDLTSSAHLDKIDSAMLYAFGSHYINVRKYLIEDGMTDAGITSTMKDNFDLTRGFVPACFRSNAAGGDLNGAAYKLIGRLVYERMDHLGYFDEIRDELNLNKTIQNILKNDPAYFDKQLQAS